MCRFARLRVTYEWRLESVCNLIGSSIVLEVAVPSIATMSGLSPETEAMSWCGICVVHINCDVLDWLSGCSLVCQSEACVGQFGLDVEGHLVASP